MRASIVVGLSRVSICDIRSREHPYGTLWIHSGNHSQSCAKFFSSFHMYMLWFNLILRLNFISLCFWVW